MRECLDMMFGNCQKCFLEIWLYMDMKITVTFDSEKIGRLMQLFVNRKSKVVK